MTTMPARSWRESKRRYRQHQDKAMIPELGHFALVLAFLLAIAQSTLPLIGAARRDARLMATAPP